MTGRATLVAVVAALSFAAPPVAHAQSGCEGTSWLGAWAASPSDATNQGFADQSLRLIVTPHVGGTTLRVRLTNRFGNEPLVVGAARVGLRAEGAQVRPGTNRAATFGGRPGVTIPRGGEVVSDPVELRFEAFDDVAISLYVPGPTGVATQHFGARQTSFLTPPGGGDRTADEAAAPFTQTTTSWFFLAGLDVRAPSRTGAVVALGDSITDGFQGNISPVNENPDGIDEDARYPDFLARRLLAEGGEPRLSVLNAGISGNRNRQEGQIPQFGPPALARLADDVLAQPGVTDVIVLEGINDIGQLPNASSDEVIAALQQVVARLQGHGLNVLLGTLTPAGGTLVDSYGGEAADATRRRVNDWIRSSGVADGVVDFDAAVRDPADPSRLLPRYDSSDHLHPSTAGYEAMAAAVDLSLLRGTGCARAPRPSPGGTGGDDAAPPAPPSSPGPRVKPRVSVRVTPARDTRGVRRLVTRGRLRVPPGVACAGSVTVVWKARGKTISSRRARVRDCRFTSAVAFRRPSRFGAARRLAVHVRFHGTTTLAPAVAPVRRVAVRR